MNIKYNNSAVSLLSVITAGILSFSMLTGYISYSSGETGVGEFWLILPYHIICIVLSLAAFVVLKLLRAKKLSSHWVSDLMALIQMCILMTVVLISSHVEIPVIGIKNINGIILVMFAIGFFIRFRLTVTLILEAAYMFAAVLLLFFEKDGVMNFLPSLINLIASYVIASLAAFLYWESRVRNFICTKELEALATVDKLTRLHNRGSFDAYIQGEWERVYKENNYLSIFFLDVDDFKKYNDTYGHVEGDKCLSAVADVIAKSVRKSDFVARYGGEEFVVVLSGANAEICEKIAVKMMHELQSRKIPHKDSVTPYVTFSIGCMVCRPQTSGVNINEFITMADNALYMAKNQGRNRLVIHPDALMMN